MVSTTCRWRQPAAVYQQLECIRWLRIMPLSRCKGDICSRTNSMKLLFHNLRVVVPTYSGNHHGCVCYLKHACMQYIGPEWARVSWHRGTMCIINLSKSYTYQRPVAIMILYYNYNYIMCIHWVCTVYCMLMLMLCMHVYTLMYATLKAIDSLLKWQQHT